MTRREIANVALGATWNSWAGSAYAVLRAAGMYEEDVTDFLGRTAFAFHFHISRGGCPSSATEFPWTDLPVYALDLLGVDSEAFQVAPPGMQREPAKRARAVERIKASIDRGLPVIAWAPSPVLEFGVVHGYDDASQAFLVEGYGPPGHADPPLPYAQLGKGEVPVLFYQLVYGREPVSLADGRRRALELAVKLWTPSEQHPGRGKDAYPVLLDALRREDFHEFGVAYNMAVYADAKRHAFAYLAKLSATDGMAGLAPARDRYAEVASKLTRVSQLFPFRGPASKLDRASLPEAIALIEQSATLEDEARSAIASVIAA